MDDAALQILLGEMCRVARPIILQYVTPDSCIASTRIGLEVLRLLKVPAYPLAVKVMAFNAKGDEFMGEGRTDLVKAGRYGSYSVGIGYGYGPKGDQKKWDGHLILIVRRTYLLDLSIDQASRPEHELYLHPSFTLLKTGQHDLLGTGHMLLSNPRGGSLRYEINPTNKAWKNAPDWNLDRWTNVVQEILQTIQVSGRESGGGRPEVAVRTETEGQGPVAAVDPADTH